MNPDQDIRETKYHDLHGGQLQKELDKNRHSAQVLLARVQEYVGVKSMLDVGCGLGTWLHEGQAMGFEVAGVEGPWSEPDKLEIDPSLVTITDLEAPIDLGRTFDLAVCLEVGEHLSDKAAPHLVNTLTSHAPHIMFSAAVPYQGGHHHINEQTHQYWIDLFAAKGFRALDIFRAKIWHDQSIHWWLSQNLLLFAREDKVQENPRLLAESKIDRPMDLVHPTVFLNRMNSASQRVRMLMEIQNAVNQHGRIEIRKTANGIEMVRP
jgi:SAM-dependent methyltransferase